MEARFRSFGFRKQGSGPDGGQIPFIWYQKARFLHLLFSVQFTFFCPDTKEWCLCDMMFNGSFIFWRGGTDLVNLVSQSNRKARFWQSFPRLVFSVRTEKSGSYECPRAKFTRSVTSIFAGAIGAGYHEVNCADR